MLKLILCMFVSLAVHAQPVPSPDSHPADEEDSLKSAPIQTLPYEPGPIEAAPAPPPPADVVKPTEAPPSIPAGEPVPEGHFQETNKPSSGSGEPIFDWSKHKNESEVKHPFAEKGLIRITKDRDYLYKVDESEQSRAFDFRVGLFNPTNLKNPKTNRTFADTYDNPSGPALLFNYEWQLLRGAIGKLGLQVGAGAFVAQGHGHFNSAINADKTPREVFTFALIPVNVGAVYRFGIWHRQLLVPYVAGGGTLFGFTEMRDDDKPPKFGGSLGAYYAAGGAFNLTYFDALSRINLDREYGINAVYLTVEYRGIVSLSNNFDFSSDLLNAGFLLEY